MSDNNDTKNTFASFMSKNSNSESKSSSGIITSNKTKEALENAKEEKAKEQKKELEEAKKNSMALANRYGKADMMKMQARNMIIMIPFIIIGIVIFLLILVKGGDWLNGGINKLFNAMVGK